METPEEWLQALQALSHDHELGDAGDERWRLIRKDVLEPLRDHRAPFAHLVSPESPTDDPFGNRFQRLDGRGAVKPRAVSIALKVRNEFMKFAVVAALRGLESNVGNPDLNEIARQLSENIGNRDHSCVMQAAGIPPQKSGRRGFEETDYAHDERADTFFNVYLRNALSVADRKYGTHLADSTDGDYRRYEDLSIERWGRVWSAGLTIDTLEWIRGTRVPSLDVCPTACEMAVAMWCTNKRFHPGKASLLPSDHKLHPGLCVSLQLRAVLAQMLEYEPERWAAADATSYPVRIRIHAVNEERRNNIQYYWGRSMSQIRFAVTAETLLQLSTQH